MNRLPTPKSSNAEDVETLPDGRELRRSYVSSLPSECECGAALVFHDVGDTDNPQYSATCTTCTRHYDAEPTCYYLQLATPSRLRPLSEVRDLAGRLAVALTTLSAAPAYALERHFHDVAHTQHDLILIAEALRVAAVLALTDFVSSEQSGS